MLDDLRIRIDAIDDEINRLFLERLDVTKEVAKIKKENGLPVLNEARECEIKNRLTEGLDGETKGYVELLFDTIFELSRTQQEKLISGEQGA